tara:strand:+ start:381 stop:734 length:354 start_codon:yes stop_codon:yes gene_type:complete
MYCYWNDIYINKWKIEKRLPIEHYYNFGNELILSGLKKGRGLKEIEIITRLFLDKIAERKRNKQAIYRSDHLLAVQSVFALLKLKKYIENDLLIIMRKKNKRLASIKTDLKLPFKDT